GGSTAFPVGDGPARGRSGRRPASPATEGSRTLSLSGLERADVRGLHPLRALGQVVLDLLVLLQRAVALRGDLAEVGEDVGAAVIRGDEPEPLLRVEP